jgi:hypothetical protein
MRGAREPSRAFVFFGRKRLAVWSNADSLGTNVLVEFDAETGEVLHAAWLPR